MKRLLIIFLTIPLLSFTQININIEIIDAVTQKGIWYAGANIDDKYATTNHEGVTYIENVNIESLADTLYIEHLHYQFENKPILYNDIQIVNRELHVKIYGHQYIHNFNELEVSVAKSKKFNATSITLNAFHSNHNAVIKLFSESNTLLGQFERHASNKNYFQLNLNYSLLENGYFEIVSYGEKDTLQFDAEQWFQLHYLDMESKVKPNEIEVNRVKLFFQEQLEMDEKLKTISKLYRDSIYKSYSDSLNLLGEEAPIFDETEQRNVNFDNIKYRLEDVTSTIGQTAQGLYIVKKLSGIKVKKSGNITVELTISKYGECYINILHASPHTEKIQAIIIKFLSFGWKPASQGTQKVEQKIIYSFNLVVS